MFPTHPPQLIIITIMIKSFDCRDMPGRLGYANAELKAINDVLENRSLKEWPRSRENDSMESLKGKKDQGLLARAMAFFNKK